MKGGDGEDVRVECSGAELSAILNDSGATDYAVAQYDEDEDNLRDNLPNLPANGPVGCLPSSDTAGSPKGM